MLRNSPRTVLAGHRFAQAGSARTPRGIRSAPSVYVSNADGPEPSNDGSKTVPVFRTGRASRRRGRARARRVLRAGRQIAKCGNSPAAAAHSRSSWRARRRLRGGAGDVRARVFVFGASRFDKTETDEEVSKDASNDDTRAAGASLPEIDAGDVVVSFEDGDGGVFSDALEKTAPKSTRTRRFPEERWRALESDGVVPAHLAHASEVRGATWLDAPRNAGKTKKKGGEQFGVCAAGETVYVSSRFRNPLEIPLALTEVSLRCAFEKKGRDDHSTFAENSEHQSEHVSIPKLDITLRPLETRPCGWRDPPAEGTLRVSGVSWRLRSAGRLRRGGRVKGTSTQRTRNSCRSTCAARTRRGADGVVRSDTPRERRSRCASRRRCRARGSKRPVDAGGVAKSPSRARRRRPARIRHTCGFATFRTRPRGPISRPRRCACACVCPVRG